MKCNCKDLQPIFLGAIERDISSLPGQGTLEISELKGFLRSLAADCGFEKTAEGYWYQFPKQGKALEALGSDYEIIKEHDDGDLTIRIPKRSLEAVVTTEGEVFTRAI